MRAFPFHCGEIKVAVGEGVHLTLILGGGGERRKHSSKMVGYEYVLLVSKRGLGA